ncbi:class I SAM-dependent methyltransferase [Agreia sp. VKM Ac-1783]|uniref:class I SAM-dependent methyltransferase n=1 Tax=Agreia sp. VKM Ac-1783 TaxID=1938889 RepID=UPI000A2AA4C6|nr:class I SAM-dependent methyltransferase [Agreia sp. VKM Ac-1783]SMQ71287.1 Methyltransferase domain-containing protein [Agreia sp. VKM Ac-1783]
MARSDEHALSFGRNVGDYDRGRPSYPSEAVDWILEQAGPTHPSGMRVADLGAGTGKFTARLVSRGMTVVAVEPDPLMRERLAQNLPAVTALEGSGEHLPLDDASVALITVAQAWHWVDVPATSLEVARVLEPGGALALVWNIRDSEVDWVARLGEVMGASEAEKYDSQTPPVGAPLERQAYREFRWVAEMSREQFLAMVTSRSYVITMADAERDEMLARLGKLLDEHPDLAGRTSYPMPYVTRVTIARVAA